MDNILLVEAIAKHAESIRAHLEKHKFKVAVASTVEQVKEQLKKQRPDFWVIDLNIGGDRFFEFYRWLTETTAIAAIPRLFITGKTQPEIANRLTTEYEETVLDKPLNITEFVAAIHRLRGQATVQLGAQEDNYLTALIGRKVGSAIVREEIARGGMGAVFLGFQESLNRQVAVKVLLPSMIGDAAIIERFQREAKATAQLKSPHIVQIFDFGKLTGNVFYIIMEYLPGETVEHFLDRRGRFPLEKAVSVISQVAKGLTAAHDAQLIHRDIKPSNLIMNNAGHVTITDFGLVRPQKKVQQTQVGMIVGTPQYLAPEQASSIPMDLRADIYSLGIVFYQLLSGQLPFMSNTPMELLMKHMNEPMPDPRQILPEIPDRIVEIIQRMTAKDPNDRYIGCRELLWDLESFEKTYTPTGRISPGSQMADVYSGTKSLNNISMETSFNQGLVELQNRFPSLFTRDKLQGTMTLTESGALLNRQGVFPEEWKNPLYILQESTKEINAAVQLGQWKFKIIETPDEIVAQFPIGTNLATMRFEQTDTASFSSDSMTGHSTSFRRIELHTEPLRQIVAIAGVTDVILFDVGGQLVLHHLKDSQALEEYSVRFPPAAQIIQSISFKINAVDLWFEKGRVLLWRLENGLLLVIASQEVSRSFLSIFISSHLEELNKLATGRKITEAFKKEPPQEVSHPVSPALMEKIQLELARMIGPIAKILINKEIKALGYSMAQFPHQQISALIKRLASKLEPSKKERFNEKVQDILYEERRKK